MRRIHEALKRAAQEKTTPLAPGLEVPAAGSAAETPRFETVVSVPRPATPRVGAAAGKVVASGYEELIMRCCHPEWRLDPLHNVFQNPEMGQGAAERFRALRSRLYQIAGARTLRRLLVTSSVAGE